LDSYDDKLPDLDEYIAEATNTTTSPRAAKNVSKTKLTGSDKDVAHYSDS
jgi:hypothetical protein